MVCIIFRNKSYSTPNLSLFRMNCKICKFLPQDLQFSKPKKVHKTRSEMKRQASTNLKWAVLVCLHGLPSGSRYVFEKVVFLCWKFAKLEERAHTCSTITAKCTKLQKTAQVKNYKTRCKKTGGDHFVKTVHFAIAFSLRNCSLIYWFWSNGPKLAYICHILSFQFFLHNVHVASFDGRGCF